MGYLNISEWSADQVIEWVRGLDDVLHQYIPSFKENNVKGQRLLTISCDDLEGFSVQRIGHQELFLEAIERLRSFHYELERENIQQLAVRVCSVANCLRDAADSKNITRDLTTRVLADVALLMATVKPLVCWLDRSPFSEQAEYREHKATLLKLALEASTYAQRGRFAERPADAIASRALTLANLANHIIQEISDPMILQPASLQTVCFKKKENQLGFDIVQSIGGHHQIANIKFGSPAHACAKIEEGDEIIQANYQTVIGWSLEAIKQVCLSPSKREHRLLEYQPKATDEIVLTLRRRPSARSSGLNGPQLRPFRPIRRPWAELNGHSNAKDSPVTFKEATLRSTAVDEQSSAGVDENSSSDESDLLSPPASPLHPHNRLYQPKPRSLVQRRNTISGSSPVSKIPHVSIEQFWRELKDQKSYNHTGSAQMTREHQDDEDSFENLIRRDKAQSCCTGLELTPRPNTYLGVGLTSSQKGLEQEIETNKNRGKLDKSHSTPAYDFGNASSGEEPSSLVSQTIPESPTTPNESPTIVIHSALKTDQILDFKKSSTQIAEAIKQQSKQKEGVKFDFTTNSSQVLETINIAMMEQQKKDKKTLTKNTKYETQITNTATGETATKTFSVNEQVELIQNEIVEAINVQRLTTSFSSRPPSEEPPVIPPRPPCTQKPAYTPKEYIIPVKDNRLPDFPPLKAEKAPESPKDFHPFKPIKHLDISQISPPIKHIRKQDIQVIPNVPLDANGKKANYFSVTSPSRDLDPKLSPRLNKPEDLHQSNSDLSKCSDTLSPIKSPTLSLPSPSRPETAKMLSPTNTVRGIFPSSKSRSLKKKNSILMKRRKVSVKELIHGEFQGMLYQRCRTKTNNVIWYTRWYVLVGNTLYGFKTKDSTKADCLIFLNGFTVSVATEVKSKPNAFRVYHTGTCFYFAAETEELMQMWYDCITKATMLNYDSWERAHKKEKKVEESKHFSETDYSDEDSTTEKEGGDKSKDVKEKDKSKFGSLKKFTNIMHRAESSENVNQASSLDRKYLLFFSSRHGKHKEDKKSKNVDSPKPTEQYRSFVKIPYSNVPLQSSTSTSDISEAVDDVKPQVSEVKEGMENMLQVKAKHKDYIHASIPNLLDFEKSDFHIKPGITKSLPKTKQKHPENFLGFVTLEEFMLKKQEEERKELYSNRALLGVSGGERKHSDKIKDVQKEWESIIPDVIYGELPPSMTENMSTFKDSNQNRLLPEKPAEEQNPNNDYTDIVKNDTEIVKLKPISIRGKDGYEKIVYTSSTVTSKPDPPARDSSNKKPPDVLPRKPVIEVAQKETPISSAKELGYEFICGDGDQNELIAVELENKSNKSISTNTSSKDLGYETLYSTENSSTSVSRMSNNSSAADEPKLPKKMSEEKKKPLPPPKIMPKSKQVLNKQSTLMATSNRNSGIDTNPVFNQGENPEKFWLNSLRRNDKVHQGKADVAKSEKFYTKHTEPFIRSSEATIVKADKSVKNAESSSPSASVEKVLKSANQYKPISLPIMSSGSSSLKTSPKFEMNLDSSKPSGGISRLRAMFQTGTSSSSSQGAASPKPKRSVFKKAQTPTSAEDWSHSFTYTKVERPPLVRREKDEPEEPLDPGIVTMRNCIIPDYPNMEYPPTFEPETYSLDDPTTSLRLLKDKKNE